MGRLKPPNGPLQAAPSPPPPTPFSSVPSNWLFISRSLSLTGPSTCQRWPLFGSENYFPLDCYLVEMSTNRWKISLKWMNFCGNFLKIFGFFLKKKNMFVTEGTIQVTIRYFLLQGLRMEQKCNKRWPQVAQEETVGSNRSVPIHRNSGTCVWTLVPLRPVFKETKYRVAVNWYDTCWLHTEKIPTFPPNFRCGIKVSLTCCTFEPFPGHWLAPDYFLCLIATWLNFVSILLGYHTFKRWPLDVYRIPGVWRPKFF